MQLTDSNEDKNLLIYNTNLILGPTFPHLYADDLGKKRNKNKKPVCLLFIA